MTPETILIFAVSLILLWIKPGPGQALKITRALNDGFLPAFYVVLGVITACQLFFLIAVLGLSLATSFFDSASFYLKLLGAAYLFYLGYKGFSNLEKGVWAGRKDKTNKHHFIENYFSALGLTLANPLPIFFFLGMMPALVPVGDFTAQDILLGLSVITFVGLVTDILLITMVTQIKEFLSESNFVQNINLFTSIGFLIIGAFFLYSALFAGEASSHL